MELVFTAGWYTRFSMTVNSFAAQLGEGQSLAPDLNALQAAERPVSNWVTAPLLRANRRCDRGPPLASSY